MKNYKLLFFRFIYAVVIGVFGLCTLLFVVYIGDLFTRDKDLHSIVFISAFLALSSYFIAKYVRKKLDCLENTVIDDIILRIAISNDGLITATDLALDSDFNIKEACLQLERNFNDGLCGKRYTEDSYISVYEFDRALSKEEKLNSKYIHNETT